MGVPMVNSMAVPSLYIKDKSQKLDIYSTKEGILFCIACNKIISIL